MKKTSLILIILFLTTSRVSNATTIISQYNINVKEYAESEDNHKYLNELYTLCQSYIHRTDSMRTAWLLEDVKHTREEFEVEAACFDLLEYCTQKYKEDILSAKQNESNGKALTQSERNVLDNKNYAIEHFLNILSEYYSVSTYTCKGNGKILIEDDIEVRNETIKLGFLYPKAFDYGSLEHLFSTYLHTKHRWDDSRYVRVIPDEGEELLGIEHSRGHNVQLIDDVFEISTGSTSGYMLSFSENNIKQEADDEYVIIKEKNGTETRIKKNDIEDIINLPYKFAHTHDIIYIYNDSRTSIVLPYGEVATLTIKNGIIQIENAPIGNSILVYSDDGQLCKKIEVCEQLTSFELIRNAIYIIHLGGKTFKIKI